MTVNKELSVVADSTCSPSSSSPPITSPIKRAVSTYDWSKVSDDPDTSLIYPSSSSASRDSTYRTGPPNLNEQVPPSSDLFHSFSDNELADDENEDSPHDASHGDFFGLRKQLQELDDMDDSDVEKLAISGMPNASPLERPLVTQPLFPQRVASAHATTSPAEALSNALTQDVFRGSLSTLTASSLSQSAFARGPSPLTPQVIQARRRLKRVVHDSNSESERADNNGSPATRSPAFPHAISTPKSRSSPTPPTSDDDEMPAYPMQGYNSKGKRKVDPVASRPTVVPLQFSEGPNGPSVASKKSARKDKRNKKYKIKPPTKKELKETRRDSARLAADQPVSIPRNEDNTQKYTFQHLFTTLAAAGRPIGKEPSSDPIAEFSSPPKESLPLIDRYPPPASTSTLLGATSPSLIPEEQLRSSLLESMAPLDSDSDVLPEVGELVSEEQKKQDRAHVQKALLERKKKLLLAQQATKPAVSDDDDLEVVPAREIQAAVKEEEAERKSGKKRKHSEGRKRQLNLGGIGLERQRAKAASSKDEASPFIISSVSRLKGKKDSAIMTQGELNRTLVQRVVSVNRELTKKKEEEWVRRGGNVIDGGEGASSSANDASTAYAEKGLKVAEERGTAMEVDEDEGSDEEWTPEMRESASPSPQSDDGEHGDEETQAIEEEEEQEADITMVNPESEVLAMDDDFDEKQVLKVRTRRRVQAIVDSDSDGGNDENTFPIPKPKQHVFLSLQDHSNEDAIIPLMSHRGSLSSTDERTEDENDKENNTSLMFDRSEDKENKAVVRHGDASTKHPLGTRTSSLFGLEHGVARSLSLSPVLQSHDTDTDDEDDDNDDSRRPLKDLLDDDPFASQVKLSTSFTARLQQGSPATVLPLAASLATYMGKDGSYPQVLQEPSVVGGEPLQPAFSDLFESGTEKQTSTLFKRPDGGLSLSESFSDEVEPTSNKFRKFGHSAFDLTQDIALQPAFQIGSGLLRKADQIFEKEQGYLLEAASKKLQKEPTLYINDHGFLTQNRPDAASPRIYIAPSPSQTSTLVSGLDSQSSERRPLRTLSLSQSIDFDSPDAPLRRLRRAVSPPSRTADVDYRTSSSVSPSPQKRLPNVFEVMAGVAKAKNEKAKQRLEKHEFVEAEAQESDDDEMFGFGGRRKDDGEEEDGEDLDKTLETLVDDQEMDEETVNAQLVQEKYQEHADQDDREIEKLHQAAIQGDLRKKKRNHGVGMDDSDDESDEDEKNRRIRRGMHKKPKIDRDNIKDLANFDETMPFYSVYEHGLINDAGFAFLEQSQDTQDIVMGDDYQGDGGEESPETITPAEIRQLARELAEQEEDKEPVDPHDVSWIDLDASDGEGSVRVKPIDLHLRKQVRPRRRETDNGDLDSSFDAPKLVTLPEKNMARMQSWAKIEGRSRNAGTGRSVGGAAVTGHGRAKVKTGGGSLRNSSTASAASTDSSRAFEQRRPVKAMPSLLAGVAADRSTRFG